MPFIQRIEFRAHAQATEVVERVQNAVLHLFPEDIREDIELDSVLTEGHNENRIVVISTTVKKKRVCNSILDYIFSNLSLEDKLYLESTLDARVDESCTLFLRFDKQAAYLDNIKIAAGPDLISVSVHLLQYPRCVREDAKEMILSRLNIPEE
ncbi:MAG: hypothetical protein GF309_15380 [Candidatus Lokiarchaeota archaeon]|nr:hypothetical protein [Candidatus Lokiarchaeota archaeon]